MRNNQVRMRIEFENIPIIDAKGFVNEPRDLDNMVGELKRKLFGK